jgi:hypothetical protein
MSVLKNLRQKVSRHGARAALHAAGMRLVNAVAPFKSLRGVYLEEPDPAFLQCPAGLTARFATPEMLREFTRDPDNELSMQFVEEALVRGDQCFAICDGSTLASYGWYTTKPASVGLPGFLLHFDPRWTYMYKGFTHRRNRGQRLHAFGMAMAMHHYRERGFRGLVSYVESTNADSLKSCARLGYREFGSVYLLNFLGRWRTLSSPGCEQFSFRIRPTA